jgi:hypothetical protein
MWRGSRWYGIEKWRRRLRLRSLPARLHFIEPAANAKPQAAKSNRMNSTHCGASMTTKRQSLVRGNSIKATKPSEKLAAVEAWAEVQGIRPITEPLAMKADFWPADESVDVFVDSIRNLRRQGK